MKVLTKKYLILEHQIVKIILDPNEYLLYDVSNDPNIGLKSQLATFIKNPSLRFIGIDFYLHEDDMVPKRLGGVIPSQEHFDELMQDVMVYDFLDLSNYL